MLTIVIPASEYFDAQTQEFKYSNECTLLLEHSLVSVSKWEAKWKIPFLSDTPKTEEQTIDYIRCMTVTRNVDPFVYYRIDQATINTINNYISDPMTATTFSSDKREAEMIARGLKKPDKKRRKITTSEEIYYSMAAAQIPFSAEKWHLNRLLTLLRIASVKNQPNKKIGKRELMNRNRMLNEARKASHNTTG